MVNIALVTVDATHSAATNTKLDLESLGHTVTFVTDVDIVATDFTPYDLVAVVRASASQTPADEVNAAWASGKPVLFGSLSGGVAGSGQIMPATKADLTGTWNAIGNTSNGTENFLLGGSHPIVAGLAGGRHALYSVGNWMWGLNSLSFVGEVLAYGDPDITTGAWPVLIAVPTGTERLNTMGPTPARAVAWGDFYAGQGRYTAAGLELLNRIVTWLTTADVPEPGPEPEPEPEPYQPPPENDYTPGPWGNAEITVQY